MHHEGEVSVEIARPVEEVFAYVTDPGYWSQWSGPVIEVRRAQLGPLALDATFTVVAKLVGRQFETESRVTGYEQPAARLPKHVRAGTQYIHLALPVLRKRNCRHPDCQRRR